jgi:hypothetical protein
MRILILTRALHAGPGMWEITANHREGCLRDCVEHGFDTVEQAAEKLETMLAANKTLYGMVVEVHREYV